MWRSCSRQSGTTGCPASELRGGRDVVTDVRLCPVCGLNPCIVRGNGRALPACKGCWPLDKAPLGATNITQHGYRRIKVETGWRFEHIVVAESVLGRPLRPDEQVGWVNGDKTDNDPANLVIGVTRFHPLVEAPKRPKDRTGEKHKPRVEVRLHPIIRARIEEMVVELAEEGTPQTFAQTVAALAEHAALDAMDPNRRLEFWNARAHEAHP